MKPSLNVKDSLTVTFFEEGTNGEAMLKIVELIDIRQIGTSYKASGIVSPETSEKEYFLKIPDPVEASLRDSLRDRFVREWRRGEELNDLADTISKLTPTTDELLFNLPKLIRAGLIQKIAADSAHQFCGLPFILYEWDEGQQLDKVMADESANSHALKLREKWFEFARGLTQIVGRLHNHGFLHAYIVPRNILISTQDSGSFKCTLAGFGYSALSIEESSEPQTEVTEDKPYQAPEFSSRRPLDALWHPADIFSVGSVLLYLATGKKPETDNQRLPGQPEFPRKVDDLKGAVRTRLVEAKKRLEKNSPVSEILANDNVAKIIDNCLRFDPDDRIATAEDVLEAIDIAATKPIAESTNEELGPFFAAVLQQREKEFKGFKERLKARLHFELYGSRTKIIEGLCRMLGGLGSNASYRTVTLPSYWTNKNLGPDGRFLAMNKHVARRGVKIERIFLVSGPFHTLSDAEQTILKSQRLASDDLAGEGHKTFQVKVHVVDQATIHGFERQGKSVAFVAWVEKYIDDVRKGSEVSKGQFLCLNFISRGEEKNRYGKSVIEREIKKVRIWDPGRGKVYTQKLKQEIKSFDDYWTQGSTLNLEQYIEEGSSLKLEDLLKRGR